MGRDTEDLRGGAAGRGSGGPIFKNNPGGERVTMKQTKTHFAD